MKLSELFFLHKFFLLVKQLVNRDSGICQALLQSFYENATILCKFTKFSPFFRTQLTRFLLKACAAYAILVTMNKMKGGLKSEIVKHDKDRFGNP